MKELLKEHYPTVFSKSRKQDVTILRKVLIMYLRFKLKMKSTEIAFILDIKQPSVSYLSNSVSITSYKAIEKREFKKLDEIFKAQ